MDSDERQRAVALVVAFLVVCFLVGVWVGARP